MLFGVWIWFVLFLLLPYGSVYLRVFTSSGDGDFNDGNTRLLCALTLIIFILLVLFTLCGIVLYRSHRLTINDFGIGIVSMILTHAILDTIFTWYWGPIPFDYSENQLLCVVARLLLLLFDVAIPLTYLTYRLLKKLSK